MSSPLIFLPRKSTSAIDFGPHLRSVIARTYSEAPAAYNEEIGLLNRSRQDALSGSSGDSTGRDLLYKYFGQLEQLELRFPDLKVPFPWDDAFTQKSISQLSLAYEKASVIYNIGATLSSLAAAAPRSSPEGLKRAFHAFRCAGGMYTYINENFLHAPSTDLSREVVKVLVTLMEAQATEVFIETMGEKVGKSAGLKARVCMQAAMLYAGMVEEIKEWVVKEIFIKEWSNLVQTKAKYFASLAQLNRAVADAANAKYGDSLVRFGLAESLAKEANKLAITFSSTFTVLTAAASFLPDAPTNLTELTKTHLAVTMEARAKAQRDNDLIYNAVTPSEAALPTIEKTVVAAIIPIQQVYASPEVQKIVGPDLFAKLVPLSVHEGASMYSEEKAKLVRAETERCDLAEGEMMALLEYLGLPGSLERYKSDAGGESNLTDPGGVVRGYSEEIRRQEGQGGVENMMRSLQTLKATASQDLDEAARELENESRECEAMRARYGPLWEQSPASAHTRSFRQDIKLHKESLAQAAASDRQVEAIWSSIKQDVGLLLESRALEQAFVIAVGSSGAEANPKNLLDDDFTDEAENDMPQQVAAIGEALVKLYKIKKERNDVLKDLKERVQSDDISHLLILNRKGANDAQPALFATELEKFRPHQARISTTLQHQHRALEEISADYKTLSKGAKAQQIQSQWKGAEQRKKALVERLGSATESYDQVRDGARKGLQFYQDLTELIGGLKNQITAYLNARNSERNRMASMADVKQRLEGPRPAQQSGGLERGMGGLDLGPRSPAPPQAYPQAYAPLPTSGAFSASPSPPPPASNSYTSPYQSQPPQSAYAPSPPPAASPYGLPPPQRQPSFPAPSQPVNSSFLPRPSAPVSYASYGQPSPSPYGNAPPPPPAQSPYYQPQYQPSPPPAPQGQPWQQAPGQPHSPYGPPPPTSPYGAPPAPSPYGAPPNTYGQYPPPR